MEFILFIQKMTCGFFDAFFVFFTLFGEEAFFVLLIAGLYWCVSKTDAIKLTLVYLVSAGLNYLIKSIVKRPRPSGVRKFFGGSATSTSFPSGHSQSAGCYIGGMTFRYFLKSWWKILVGIILLLLVMLSRIYLGHHYLTDVISGGAIGYAVGFFLTWAVQRLNFCKLWYLILVVPCIILPFFMENEKVAIACGGGSALIIGYVLESYFIKCDDRPKGAVCLGLRLGIGYGVLAGLFFLFKLLPELRILSFLTYFIIAAWISIGAPALFKWIEQRINKGRVPLNENV